MAKPNYKSEKRRKDLEKQKKKEEKRQRKLDRKNAKTEDDEGQDALEAESAEKEGEPSSDD